MTLQQLRVLVAVLEHRSFTRGAASVFMTQSAASQHVRSLENALGVPLVERRGSDVVPTRAGEVLTRYAREMLRVAQDAERHVADLRAGSAGRLVLGACGSAVYLVPALISGLRASYPEIEVGLHVAQREALRDALAQGMVDVALMSGPVRGPDLALSPLCPDRLVVAAAPGSPLLPAAALAPYPLARLAAEPLVAPPESSPTWQLVQRWAASHDVELRPALRLDNADAIKKAIEAGMGVGVLSAWVVEREVTLGTLRPVAVDPPLPVRQFELVRRAGRHEHGPLRTFLQFAPDYLCRRLPLHVGESRDGGRPLPAGGRPGAPAAAGAAPVTSVA